MLVSVVIPAYNRAHCIRQAINSVLQQTEQSFEIIVVDDGSTDNTEKIVKEITDKRIRYIKQENSGGSKARNTGIASSIGLFIAFLDSDDIFLPDHLQQALFILNENIFNCVYSQIIVERGNNLSFIKPPRPIRTGELVCDYLLCDRGFIQTSTLVVAASLAKKTLFDEKLKYGQDTDFAIRLFANGGKFIMARKPSVVWADEWSEKRISSKLNYENRIQWLNGVRSILSNKAYFADLGWPVAKGLAQNGKMGHAIYYYLNALFRGCFGFKLSLVIFLQVILSQKTYRKLSDFLAKFGFKP